MKLNTNVFLFSALMVASIVAFAAENQPAQEVKKGFFDQAVAVVTALANDAAGLAKAGFDGVVSLGNKGFDAAQDVANTSAGYAKDAVVFTGETVSNAGAWIQENPGYAATAVATTVVSVAVGYVVYQNYFAPYKDCKKAKTTKSNN